MTDWLAFYKRFFPTSDEAKAFVDACEAQSPPDNTAKLIMHQTQRLVSLAEDIPEIRRKRESLQAFLLVVCAEAIAKLNSGSTASIGSKAAVRSFFASLVPTALHPVLESTFTTTSTTPNRTLSLQEVADLLYEVRCDVAHEGVYWHFALSPDGTPTHTTKPSIMTRLTVAQLIDVVASGGIAAAQKHL